MTRVLQATGQLNGSDQRNLVILAKKLNNCFKDIEISPPIPDRKTIGLVVYFKIFTSEDKTQTRIGA